MTRGTSLVQSVFKAYPTGEFHATERQLTEFPRELGNTMTMQMGLTKIVMARNQISEIQNPLHSPHFHTRNLMHVTELDLQHNK